MAQVCQLCGRGAMGAHNRSHSKVATKRKQNVNLQTKRFDGGKLKVCTSCVRTLTKPNLSGTLKQLPKRPKISGSRSKKKLSSRAKKAA